VPPKKKKNCYNERHTLRLARHLSPQLLIRHLLNKIKALESINITERKRKARKIFIKLLLFTGRIFLFFNLFSVLCFLGYVTICCQCVCFVSGDKIDIFPSFAKLTTYDKVGLTGIATRFSKLCLKELFHEHNSS
jgi:hypothetical protein